MNKPLRRINAKAILLKLLINCL